MNGKWLRLGMATLALSGCVIPRDYDDDDDRPRERARESRRSIKFIFRD